MAYPQAMEDFWSVYNGKRKKSKVKCHEAWKKLTKEEQHLAQEDIEWRRDHDKEWNKDGGKWIPAPEVYLNQKRWEGQRYDNRKKATAPVRQSPVVIMPQPDSFKAKANQFLMNWLRRNIDADWSPEYLDVRDKFAWALENDPPKDRDEDRKYVNRFYKRLDEVKVARAA